MASNKGKLAIYLIKDALILLNILF